MKTTFTTFIFLIFILFGPQTTIAQNTENQLVKYKSKPISNKTASLTDTVDFNLYKMVAVAPNYLTPESQVEEMTFGSWIQTTSDTIVDYFVFDFHLFEDSSGTEVFSDSFIYDGPIGVGFCDPCLIPDKYTPPFEVKSYTGYYHTTSNIEEINSLNNYDTIKFATSDLTFAKENGGTQTIIPDPSSWGIDERHCWAFGNYYYIVNAESWKANSATFSIGNASADEIPGRLITLSLYKWNEDINEDGHMDHEERTKVAFGIYEILGTELPTDLITTPLLYYPNGEPGPINLYSNQAYALMLEYEPIDQVDLAVVVSTDIDYSSLAFVSGTIGFPRYAGLLGINEYLKIETYNSIGFGRDIVPVVRLNLVDMTSNSVGDKQPSLKWLKLFPNPTDNILNLEIDFPENQNEASIKIFDLNGRLMSAESYKNMKYEKINFDLTKFAAGTYFLQLVTDAGVRTERFVVQHF